jgi:hypothetical protein
MNTRSSDILRAIVDTVLREKRSPGISVLIEEPWLTLSTPLAGGHVHGPAMARCAVEMLQRNGVAASLAKLVIPPQHARAQAVAESAMDRRDADDAITDWVRQAVDDLALITAASVTDHPIARPPQPPPNLEELCTSAGWNFHRRGAGRIAIALDVPGSSANAVLACGSENDIQAIVEWPGWSAATEKSRQAAALLLLKVGGVVRLVRPAIALAGEREMLQLQAPLGPAPGAGELDHALAALSIACRMCQREAALLLSDESIARRYLSLCGWSAEAAASACS